MEMVGFRVTSSIWELAGGRAFLAPLCSGLVPVAIVSLNQKSLDFVIAFQHESLLITTFSDGYLGSSTDEGRSEV